MKSTSLTSLGVSQGTQPACTTATATSPCKAQFASKANITDITDPLNPIALGGNKIVQLTMTDKGDPGSSDRIGLTLTDGATLLYSTSWNGAATQELVIGGGNLVVH